MRERNDLTFKRDVLDSKELSATVILSNYSVLINLKKFFLFSGLLVSLSACSMDASIQSLSEAIDSIANLNRKDPDFIHGEVVTSGHYQVTGVFGEISEKTKAVNNSQWEIEGVFYE